MFKKTTKLMDYSKAINKAQRIRDLLGSGDGFVQLHEEDGKGFLLMEIKNELKPEVLSILRN